MGCRHVSRSKSQGRTSMFKLSIPPWVQSLRWTHLFQEIKAIVCPLMSFNQIEMTSFYRKNFCKKEGHWRRRPPCLIFFLRKNFWWSHCGKSYFFPPPFFYTDDILFQVLKKKECYTGPTYTVVAFSIRVFFLLNRNFLFSVFFPIATWFGIRIHWTFYFFYYYKEKSAAGNKFIFYSQGGGSKMVPNCISLHWITRVGFQFSRREKRGDGAYPPVF